MTAKKIGEGEMTKLIIIKYVCPFPLISCIFLFLSIYISCQNLCLLCTLYFSLHNGGHPAIRHSIFSGRCYAPLYEINNIALSNFYFLKLFTGYVLVFCSVSVSCLVSVSVSVIHSV